MRGAPHICWGLHRPARSCGCGAMRYLQVDLAKDTLYVLADHRDWSDMKEDKHFEYAVASLRMFRSTKPFVVKIDASQLPYAALLHCQLFRRIARYANAHHSTQIQAIQVINATRVGKLLYSFLKNLAPSTLPPAVTFVAEAQADKKVE